MFPFASLKMFFGNNALTIIAFFYLLAIASFFFPTELGLILSFLNMILPETLENYFTATGEEVINFVRILQDFLAFYGFTTIIYLVLYAIYHYFTKTGFLKPLLNKLLSIWFLLQFVGTVSILIGFISQNVFKKTFVSHFYLTAMHFNLTSILSIISFWVVLILGIISLSTTYREKEEEMRPDDEEED